MPDLLASLMQPTYLNYSRWLVIAAILGSSFLSFRFRTQRAETPVPPSPHCDLDIGHVRRRPVLLVVAGASRPATRHSGEQQGEHGPHTRR